MEKDQIYVEALKLLLEQTDKEFAQAQSGEEQVRELLSQMAQNTEAVKSKREKIQAELAALLMKPAAESLALPLNAHDFDAGAVRTSQSRRAWKNSVVEMIHMMLRYGRMKTDDIYSNLITHGVSFEGIADPRHRVVQILSESPMFERDRALGWGLKDEDPAATGSSGATQSLAGPHVGDLTGEKGHGDHASS